MPATIQTPNKPLHPRVLDTSGNNNHGTPYTGQALEFDGVSDYISADVLDIDVDTENWTISCWINITAYASNSSYINVWGNAKDSSNRIGIQAYDQDSDSPKLAFVTYNGSSYVSTASDVELDKDTWYYIVATCASNTLKLYINGTLQSGSTVATSLSNTVKCVVGGTASGSNVFNGKISNFQIWNALWSASDISYAYLNPERLALGNSGTSLTYSDLKLWYPMQDGHRGNQSYLLDGANSTGLGDDLASSLTWVSDASSPLETLTSSGNVVTEAANTTGWGIGATTGFSLTAGVVYKLVFDFTLNSGTVPNKVLIALNTSLGSNQDFIITGIENGLQTHYFTVSSTRTDWRFGVRENSATNWSISDLSIKAVKASDKNHGTSVFYGEELAVNGTMEADSNWNDRLLEGGDVQERSSTRAHAGTYSRHVNVDAANEGTQSDAWSSHVVAGRTYYIEAYVWIESGEVYMLDAGGNCDFQEELATTGSWQKMSATATAASNGAEYVKFVAKGAAAEFYVDSVTVKEVGFATGWTDADAQTTIPQLGFQSYNQLAWFDGTADYVDLGISANADLGLTTSFTVSCWAIASNSTIGYLWNLYQDTANAIGIKMHKTVIQIYDDMTSNDTAVYNTAIAGDVWHHIVLSVDDSDMTLYVDGVSIGTGTDMTESLDQATYDLYIGSRQDTPTITFAGCVTEWSIFNSALTLAKVQELYNDGEALDALTHSSVANLVGYWRNEGGTTWTDLSGNDNDGTPTSVSEQLILPEGQNGRDTQGFLMSRDRVGVNLDGIGYTKGALTTDLTTAATWGFWMNQETLDVKAGILGKGDSASNSINFYTWTDGGFYFDIRTGSTITGSFDYSSAISPKTWYYLTVVFDGSLADNATRLKIYVNGAAQTLTFEGTVPTSLPTNDDLQYIGSLGGSYSDDANPFNGQIDDVSIYNAALTVTQVTRNYKAGKGRHRN